MIIEWLRSKFPPEPHPPTEPCDESESMKLVNETYSTIESRRKTKAKLDKEIRRSNPADIVNVMLHAKDRVTAP